MSWIRPRGESASSPRTRYVGQSLRHNPHEMQVARSSERTGVKREVMLLGYESMALATPTLADRLRDLIPGDRVIDDPTTLLPYAYDASFWSLRKTRMPDVVVVPLTTDEVARVVRFADSTGTPVVPRGAGTGQTGGAVAARGGIVISFARMRAVIEIDRKNLQAVVEPGLVFIDLQDALRPHGLFFPPDPGSGRACTLGGMAANNASGPHAVRWGTTSAYVLGAEVVLADGSVIMTGGTKSKALKSSSGIDLTKLFVGSEGTLGIITKLRLRSAVDALQRWKPELGLPEGEAVLFIEVEGTPDHVASSVRYVDGIVRRRATTTKFAEEEGDIQRLWAARSGLAAAAALAHPDKHRIFAGEDLAVPLSEIPRTIRRAREMGMKLNVAVIFYGHFGDGNVHSAILIDPSDADEVRRADQLADRLHKLAVEVGGTVTGEHGTGAVRQPYMRLEHGDALDTMQKIKDALDPKGILNPGKIYGQ